MHNPGLAKGPRQSLKTTRPFGLGVSQVCYIGSPDIMPTVSECLQYRQTRNEWFAAGYRTCSLITNLSVLKSEQLLINAAAYPGHLASGWMLDYVVSFYSAIQMALKKQLGCSLWGAHPWARQRS